MPDMFDEQQRHLARGEDGPDVEGHVDPMARSESQVESASHSHDEDEGPDVEGHGHRLHRPS